jgi:hypothetical protein
MGLFQLVGVVGGRLHLINGVWRDIESCGWRVVKAC